jgi:hypothetical protein
MSVEDRIDLLLDQPFVFRNRPISAPPDLRPVWRVPVVLLLVRACRGDRATHEQLQVLNWAIRSGVGAETLRGYLAGEIPPEQAIVRFDPALDRAVALARGLGFIDWATRFWVLTSVGREAVKQVDEAGVLDRERSLLAELPKPLTQAAVGRLLKREIR